MKCAMMCFDLFRITFRILFYPEHRFHKEYEEAMDAMDLRGHWLYLYDSLEGPYAEQVLEALKKYVESYKAVKQYEESNMVRRHYDVSSEVPLCCGELRQLMETEEKAEKDLLIWMAKKYGIHAKDM